jgi:hypothetical protein
MSNAKPVGALIPIAARLVRGQALVRLYEVCENQKSISTEKLRGLIEDVENKLKDEAVYIKNTHRRIIEAESK